MVTREHSRTETPRAERAALSAGALESTSHALLVTALVGGAALVLERSGPWRAGGYVVRAAVLGCALARPARGVQRSIERESEELRRRHRPE